MHHFKLNSTFLAKVLSFLSNPFFLIFLAVVIGDSEFIFDELGQILMFVVVGISLPLIVYINQILKHKEHFWHFISLNRDARVPVYLISIYSAFFNILIFSYLHLSFWVFQGILIFILFTLMYIINRYIDKVSMHTAAFTFATFYLIDKASTTFVLLLLLLPLVYWARIKLHRHTKFQLFLGTMVGVFVGLVAWLR